MTGVIGVVPISGLVQKPANPFDLQGTTLRFVRRRGGYEVQVVAGAKLVSTPTSPSHGVADPSHASWSVGLPFKFPFGDGTYDHVFVNLNGNISFSGPEGKYWSERDPWSDAGMRSVAVALDSRSAAGLEQMISVLWGACVTNDPGSSVRVGVSNDVVAVTWNVRRTDWNGVPRSKNAFQARLYRDGTIELAYLLVSEDDGIVGLFTSANAPPTRLDHVGPVDGDAAVAIEAVDVYDAGTVLEFVYTMKNDLPAQVSAGKLMYRFFLESPAVEGDFGASLGRHWSDWFGIGPAPRRLGFQTAERSVTFFLSKLALAGESAFDYSGDVVWWGAGDRSAGLPGKRRINRFEVNETDLSRGTSARRGNVFEVFHHPLVNRSAERILKSVYRTMPPNDDIAVVCTDQQMDEVFPGAGPGTGPLNAPVHRIGQTAEEPDTKRAPSERIQASMVAFWIGGPAFAATGRMGNQRFHHFAKGVFWIAHEATHRWGPWLRMRDPEKGWNVDLADIHWLDELNAPAFVAVASKYVDGPTEGHSIMGGNAWKANADGTYSRSAFPWAMPGGLSALDLYSMGLLAPAEVPETFLLQDPRDLGDGRFKATALPVRIDDIIAAMGPRNPDSASSQKEFRMALYLVHEPDHEPDARLVERANGLVLAVADFFQSASGGRMKITQSLAKPVSTP